MQRRHFMAPSGGALLAGAVGSAFAKPASDITAYFVPGGQFGLNPWFLNNGTDRLTPDGRESNVRDRRFRETLEFLHSMIFEHKVSPTFVRNDYGHGPFIAGQVAMFSGTHGRIPEMITAKLETVAAQYFPRKLEQIAIMGVGGIGITEASKNPDLAWEFLKELTGGGHHVDPSAPAGLPHRPALHRREHHHVGHQGLGVISR